MEEPAMLVLIRKLSFLKGVNLLLIGFGTIVAPFWFLFQFYPGFVGSADFMKTLILSISIGTPVCLLMSVINWWVLSKPSAIDNNILIELRFLLMGISSAYCGFAMYAPCVFKYLKPNLQPGEAITLACCVFAGGAVFSIFTLIKRGISNFKNRKVTVKSETTVE
jgi:hypothetical protein